MSKTTDNGQTEAWEPNIVDLQDWLIACKPDIFARTRYLSAPYRVWLQAWIEAGRPMEYEWLGQTWSVD